MEQVWGDRFLSGQRVLVIAPHADDESYGCAGTIARIKSLGGEAYVLLGSPGGVDHYGPAGHGEMMHRVSAQTRLREFAAVMELLKVDDWEVMYTGESMHLALDTVPRKDLVRLIERDARLAVENVQPTMLFIPSMSYNQDHEALFRACMTAARPGLRSERHFIPFVLGYDNTSLFWAPEPNGSTRACTSMSAIS
ncbi:PIG-L deacetylase family protein [Arthrobacter sp. MMS18-M83]|uniref:PIG-L deacetylase family protein n=1 Tax=Arthrobacter sp. MMS18-M83 TaxID=2996261 RepID=UPI00227BCB10|nr:PIG-L family deacetylase [Arthrobacter sp. MMS18-M83]WAH98129.1 PIG-L family deacetylase [Arthrobacter sp. MMS18-M83]